MPPQSAPATRLERTAGAVRMIAVLAPDAGEGAGASREKVGAYAARYLAGAVKPPYQYEQLGDLTFTIGGPKQGAEFDAYIDDLHRKLQAYLFGEHGESRIEVLPFAGAEPEVAEFVREDDAAALARSEAYLDEVARERAASDAEGDSEHAFDWRARLAAAGPAAFAYRGVFACARQLMFSYLAAPRNPNEESQDLHPGAFTRLQGARAIDFETDAYAKAAEYAKLFADNRMPLFLMCPVSFDTLMTPRRRRAYVEALLMDQPYVGASLIATIVDAPDTPSYNAIQRCVAQLSSAFKFIDWQVSRGDVQPERFGGQLAQSVTLDLRAKGIAREIELKRFLDRTPDLHALKIKAGVTGLATAAEVARCVERGIDYCSGDAVTPVLDAPRTPTPTPVAALPFA